MFKFLAFLTEGIAWLQIMVSPFLIGLGLGFVEYKLVNNTIGLVIAIIIATLGLGIGITLATKAWCKKGTVDFISRINRTGESVDISEQDQN